VFGLKLCQPFDAFPKRGFDDRRRGQLVAQRECFELFTAGSEHEPARAEPVLEERRTGGRYPREHRIHE
jgi:hypothetical protein